MTARLAFGPASIFWVGPLGRLSALPYVGEFAGMPFQERILELGTVDAVFAEAAKVQADQAAAESGIMRALVRELAVPWRDASPRTATTQIGIINESLHDCPPPPEAVRGCVLPDIHKLAKAEAQKGTWSIDLAMDFSTRATESVKFDRLDASGPDRVIIGPKDQILSSAVMPLQMTRPAIIGKIGLVYIQFARTFTWLVLLTDKGNGWTVTTKVANGAG